MTIGRLRRQRETSRCEDIGAIVGLNDKEIRTSESKYGSTEEQGLGESTDGGTERHIWYTFESLISSVSHVCAIIRPLTGCQISEHFVLFFTRPRATENQLETFSCNFWGSCYYIDRTPKAIVERQWITAKTGQMASYWAGSNVQWRQFS